jgi:hypothetical protein
MVNSDQRMQVKEIKNGRLREQILHNKDIKKNQSITTIGYYYYLYMEDI